MSSTRKPSRRAFLTLGIAGGLAWGLKQYFLPSYDPCPACKGHGRLSCGAPGCQFGRVPCDGPCLKRSAPNWQRMNVPGHAPDKLWARFDNDDGTYAAWSEDHLGQVIEKVNGRWENKGACPICHGSGTKACPTCHDQRRCPRCGGTGQLRHWGL